MRIVLDITALAKEMRMKPETVLRKLEMEKVDSTVSDWKEVVLFSTDDSDERTRVFNWVRLAAHFVKRE